MFCAKGGVEPQSENVWRQADTYNVPRMAFINKMDILGANFYNAVEQIKTRLGKNAICVQLPIGKEDEFKGIIDLFEMQAYIYNDDKGEDISIVDIPEDMKDEAELYRSELVEKICDLDDDLMMQYLEGEEPSVEDMKAALRKATCECRAVPVCCGSAYRNKGVQKLLDAVTRDLVYRYPGYQGRGYGWQRDRAPLLRRGAVLRSGIQDHGGPLRRKAGILPCILRNHEFRFLRIQFYEAEEGACRTYPSDARKQESRAG